MLEIGAAVGAGQGLYNTASKSHTPGEEGAPRYLCPADVPAALEAELKRLAVEAFEAMEALDIARVDFRLGRDGRPYLLEINTLPGLNPRVSDLCIMARAGGTTYTDLINEVLNLAMDRYARERAEGSAPELFQPVDPPDDRPGVAGALVAPRGGSREATPGTSARFDAGWATPFIRFTVATATARRPGCGAWRGCSHGHHWNKTPACTV